MLEEPTATVADKANILKKKVLNEMLANLMEETKLHPVELTAGFREAGAYTRGRVATRGKSARWLTTTRLKETRQYEPTLLGVVGAYKSDGTARSRSHLRTERYDRFMRTTKSTPHQ